METNHNKELELSVKQEARGRASIKQAELKADTKLRMLEGTSRILSENFGVQVVFSTDGECKTSPDRMTLPYDEAIDEALIMGLMGHETGHLRDTSFDVARVIAKMRTVKHRELLFNITNCLEDVRIERIMEVKYPGFLTMFRRMVPYIEERKIPLLELEELRRSLKEQGKSDKEIEKVVAEKNKKEIAELREILLDDYSEKLVDQLIESETKRRETGVVSELQKIMDVVYLKLRGYNNDFYPEGVKLFVDTYLLKLVSKVFDCKTTADVLKIAEEVYEILTNEKGTQVEEDRQRQEMMKKMQGQGQGQGKGQGQGQGGQKLSKEELEKLKEEARKRAQKEREERMKKRAQGADVEDFVKNKQGEKGKGEGEKGEGEGKEGEDGEGEKGEGKDGQGGKGDQGEKRVRFKVGQKVKSLDHEGTGIVTFVGVQDDGSPKVEVDWDTKK